VEIAAKQPVLVPASAPVATTPPARDDGRSSAQRPKVGTAVMVAHALGAGAVPADLEGAGFEVVVTTDAEAAMSCAGNARADIAIVDGRFEGDGLSFCERLWSAHPGFPVLFIGPNDENLVTRALAAGADDYLLLPLRPAELVARVRAVLRRAPHWASSTSPEERVLHAGDVRRCGRPGCTYLCGSSSCSGSCWRTPG
jgi:CheY-like chemotaxis protein